MKNHVRGILVAIGEDPDREGLFNTPRRVDKAWREWTAGYHIDPASLVTSFKDGAEAYDGIVLMKDIPFYSHCEHHLTPFFGKAHIAYIPKPGSVIGISKLGRILDMYAKRLQVQERMTRQIADCIQELIRPDGVAVIVEAQHLCTMSRGLNKDGHTTITSAMRGFFKDDAAARNELMLLIK